MQLQPLLWIPLAILVTHSQRNDERREIERSDKPSGVHEVDDRPIMLPAWNSLRLSRYVHARTCALLATTEKSGIYRDINMIFLVHFNLYARREWRILQRVEGNCCVFYIQPHPRGPFLLEFLTRTTSALQIRAWSSGRSARLRRWRPSERILSVPELGRRKISDELGRVDGRRRKRSVVISCNNLVKIRSHDAGIILNELLRQWALICACISISLVCEIVTRRRV